MRKLHHIDKSKSDWKEKWLQVRKKSIGASDIAGVVGLSQWKSPLSIYLDKTDQMPADDEENIAAELGLELEGFMRKKFVKYMAKNEEINVSVKEVPYILQHDNVNYFTATLDGIFKHPEKGKCILEIKTTSEFKRDAWKDDNVPDDYYAQVQWQMMITDWEWCYLVYLIGNRTLDIKLIERNEEVIKNLTDKGKDFWENFVEKNIPPAPIGLDADASALKILYPEAIPESGIELTGKEATEMLKIIEEIEDEKSDEKAAKNNKKTLEQILKAKIGENEYIKVGDKLITLKTVSVKEHLVKGSSYRKLHIGKGK